ncbi:MAG: hypothetical protein ACXVWW_01900 [Nocardioides sp.]
MSTLRLVAGDQLARRLTVLAGILALLLGVLAALPGQATAASNAPAYSKTQKLTRSYYLPSAGGASDPASASADPSATASPSPAPQGEKKTVSNTVTVQANKTTDLQSRERINISWSGAHPTGGRALNPYGINGVAQEYPVMIMECRGIDDPALPASQQLSPQTCWTSTYNQRTSQADPDHATWLFDARGKDPVLDPADAKPGVSGVDPSTLSKDCPTGSTFAFHITQFVSAPTSQDKDEKAYDECNDQTMPPSASNNAGEPTNELYAFTGPDGRGSAQFEVRTKIENEALGCSQSVPCSVVVIPMMGIDCASVADPCNGSGNFEPGTMNFDKSAIDDALSPLYWWSPSNWSRRFSIPLTFAPPPDTCSLNGSGAPVPFYGSELLSQAALQWAPAYCLNESRFNWQANSMPDEAATQLVLNGGAVASQPSARVEGDKGLAYAPTALTGWGIAYNMDRPDGSIDTSLKLNPRLIAKLLTESYPGSNLISGAHADARGKPDLAANPLSINRDPEFQALNPGLNTGAASEAAATLLALSTDSAVMDQLTSYIAADPAAMTWLKGKPDQWGMKVNSYYKGIDLPVSTWPLLDQWVPKHTGISCLDANPAPYLQKVAAPVSTFALIARAMLLSWPNVSTVCTLDPTSNTWSLGRVAQQGIGRRMQFGVVTLGDAARYGLTVASLQASPGHFVAADEAGIEAAVKLMKQPKDDKPFTLTQDDVRGSDTAYPGTSVVYTAAKGRGLAKPDAAHVAQFIQVSTTEGQAPGRGNGQLPTGYVPIRKSGPTAKLFDAAVVARHAILAQKGVPGDGADASAPTSTPPTGGGNGTTTTGGGTVATPPGVAPAPTDVVGGPQTTTGGDTTTTADGPVVTTALVSSSVGGGMLPLLLAGALAALLASLALRVALLIRSVK